MSIVGCPFARTSPMNAMSCMGADCPLWDELAVDCGLRALVKAARASLAPKPIIGHWTGEMPAFGVTSEIPMPDKPQGKVTNPARRVRP